MRYSLVDRTIEPALLHYCQRNGITVIAYSPLAQGLHRIKEMDPGNTLEKVAAVVGKTEAQVALNWCISKDRVIAIPKANSIDHVHQNCAASGWRLSLEQAQCLEHGIAFRRRGYLEAGLRRLARHCLQRFAYRGALL